MARAIVSWHIHDAAQFHGRELPQPRAIAGAAL
jgi:hypothetical protein